MNGIFTEYSLIKGGSLKGILPLNKSLNCWIEQYKKYIYRLFFEYDCLTQEVNKIIQSNIHEDLTSLKDYIIEEFEIASLDKKLALIGVVNKMYSFFDFIKLKNKVKESQDDEVTHITQIIVDNKEIYSFLVDKTSDELFKYLNLFYLQEDCTEFIKLLAAGNIDLILLHFYLLKCKHMEKLVKADTNYFLS